MPNMAAHAVGGVLMRFICRMRWVCGKISGGVGGSFLEIPNVS
jgi:hypothetical protein